MGPGRSFAAPDFLVNDFVPMIEDAADAFVGVWSNAEAPARPGSCATGAGKR